MKGKIVLAVIALLVIIQFFRIDKSHPPIDQKKDFITFTKAPAEIGTLVKNACYDCHSYETKYPWYFNVAPVSWLLKNHVNEGRRHVNFSLWRDYDKEKQAKRLDHCTEMINEGEMPLSAYVMMHSEADLSAAQKKELTDYFDSTKVNLIKQ